MLRVFYPLPTPILLKIIQRGFEFRRDFIVVFGIGVDFIEHATVAGFYMRLHGGFEGNRFIHFDIIQITFVGSKQ